MKNIVMVIFLFTSILSSDDMVVLGERNNATATEVLIHGNGEQCNAIVSNTSSGMKSIIETDCTQLTNSKGSAIICTQNKKMCKTLHELELFVQLFIYNNSNTASTNTQINKNSNRNSHSNHIKMAVKKNFKSIFTTCGYGCDPCGVKLYAKRKAVLNHIEILREGKNNSYEIKGYFTCTTYFSNKTKVEKMEKVVRVRVYEDDFGSYVAKRI